MKHFIYTVIVILSVVVPTFFIAQRYFDKRHETLIPGKENPIPVHSDARTQKDFYWEKYDWLRRLTVDAYDSAHTSEIDKSAALSFLDNVCKAYAFEAEPEDFIRLEKEGQALLAAGNTDPLISIWYGIVLYENGEPDQAVPFLDAAEIWDRSHRYPRIHAFFAYEVKAKLYSNKQDTYPETARRLYFRVMTYIVQALSKNEFQKSESHIAYRLLNEMEYDPDDFDLYRMITPILKKNKRIDPWLQNMIQAEEQINLAWKARGSGWAKDVTEEGWKGFRKHLGMAREALMKCWSLNKDRPEAAARMITVTMAGHDTERLWFDRAVRAQMDYAPAYLTYGDAIDPKWGGSVEQQMNFLEECLKTGRFDTDVPLYYFYMYRKIAGERKLAHWRTMFRKDKVHKNMRYLFEQLMKEPGRSRQRKRIQTQWAIVEAWCGDYEKAGALLDELDVRINLRKGFWGKALAWNILDWETLEAEIEAFTGPYREALVTAQSLVDSGKMAPAIDIFKGVMKLEPCNTPVFAFLRDRVATLEMGTLGEYESYPVLHKAILGNHPEVVRFLVDNGAGINAKNSYYSTPLYLAAMKKNADVAGYLIQHGADPNLFCYGRRTPLHMALGKKQHDLAMMLIQNGANINVQDYWGRNALHYALQYEDPAIAKTLIRAGVEVNAATEGKWTPLHYCAKNGYTEVAKMLLDRGADPNAKTKDGRTPLMMAQKKNNKEIEALLRP